MEKAIEVKICTLDVLVAIEMSLFLSDLVNSIYESVSCSVTCDPLQTHGLQPTRLFCSWNFPSKNTGVGCHFLLQGIFLTQESNPSLLHLLHCRLILYQLSHKGSPRILEWVVHLFSSRSSQPRNWTRVSCIAGGLFTNWAIREAPPKIFWLL